MRDQVELAKKLLESKGYAVTKRLSESAPLHPDEFLRRDAIEYLKNPNYSARWSAAYTQEVIDYIEEVGKDELEESVEDTTPPEDDRNLESILKDAGLTNIRRTRTGFASTKSEDFSVNDMYGFVGFVGETLHGTPVYKIKHQGVLWYITIGTTNNLNTVTVNPNCPRVISY